MCINKKTVVQFGLILLVAAACGCGGAKKGGVRDGSRVGGGDGEVAISKKARKDFDAAARNLKEAEQAGWDDGSCKSVAKKFEKLAKANNLAVAEYNAGVVYLSCNMHKKAEGAFKKTLELHPAHQLSLTQLAVMELEKGNQKEAEDLLREAVKAGANKIEAVPAYVNAATILRARAIKGDKEAFAKAQANLRRALAIDSKYMPALYQLSLLYLDIARSKGRSSYLTLATLVCNQAIALNPEYGPIYHALGLILLEKNELVNALQAFEKAFQKDKKLFASYMNYAAINLSFRGYESAKRAFEQAIALNPNSYDAHIGLGVALRGLGDFEGAKAEYNKASKVNSKKTDYIFNLGLLAMDYTNSGNVEGFKAAKKVFKEFVSKANPQHKVDPDGRKGSELSWVAKANDRVEKCDKNVKMIIEAEREMAELEKLAKEQAKRAAEMQAKMEKAKKLEQKEASGAVAPGDDKGVE
jgi:tetratricopeptide (TPR) repeat protein